MSVSLIDPWGNQDVQARQTRFLQLRTTRTSLLNRGQAGVRATIGDSYVAFHAGQRGAVNVFVFTLYLSLKTQLMCVSC